MFLEIENLSKTFIDDDGTQNRVLSHISLALPTGEIGVLLGPSGCGKTTLLRIIAGLETADQGRLLLNGQDLNTIPIHKRGFGFVFQDYALFPHKNVFANVAFGLRMQEWPAKHIRERVTQVLELVGLAAFAEREIQALSGGEQQRIALARALAPAPQLLLLDEPLGALDRALREQLMLDLKHILKSAGELLDHPEGITALYVTHDQAEAFALGDRIVVMQEGRIAQIAPPGALYQRPYSSFVAQFLGMENIFPFSADAPPTQTVTTPLGSLHLNDGAIMPPKGLLLIRPDAAELCAADAAVDNLFHGRLITHSFRGRYQLVEVALAGRVETINMKLEFETAVSLPPLGEHLNFYLLPGRIQLLEGG